MNFDDLKQHVAGPLSVAECAGLHAAASDALGPALEVGHYRGLSTIVLLDALPAGVSLTTVDHHRGDDWAPATDFEEFLATVDPYVNRPFRAVDDDMLAVDYEGPYSFVFYDADHHATAVEAWWVKVLEHLAPSCVLVYDDADWEEQSTLGSLAVRAGFTRDEVEFYRADRDKHDPETFTLQVCRR